MKSREGTVVDADNLIDNVKEMAKKNLLDRNKKLSKKIVEERSLIISLAAIKYTLLKIEAARNFMFDPKESISFEGNTGPYLQYSYARASSIVRKSKTKKQLKIPDNLTKGELQLLSQISKFPQIVENAAEQMNPALIANSAPTNGLFDFNLMRWINFLLTSLEPVDISLNFMLNINLKITLYTHEIIIL